MSNEEARLYERINKPMFLYEFTERERFVIENLIRKSLLSKVRNNDSVLVVKND